ncbi:hypothetical protein [Halocatena halophila]|uniref:hypothetical protein n=1 Tax=Halocatena halophila TaxID=2814576 RepID=UPI002ED2B84A
MGKNDRYNFEGTDDGLDSDDSDTQSMSPNTNSTTQTPDAAEDESPSIDTDELPYVLRRSGPSDGRNRITVSIPDEVKWQLEDFKREASEEFENDTVYDLDVRDYLIRAGLENTDDAIELMRADGFGLK